MGDLNIKDALLHLGGSISLYRSLVQGFKDKYCDIDNEIKKQLLDYDVEEARRFAHSIKGLSGNLGANELNRYSIKLEDVIQTYIGVDILEDDMNAILDKEWIMFSKELNIVVKNIDLVLKASDVQLLSAESTEQLKGSEVEKDDDLRDIDI